MTLRWSQHALDNVAGIAAEIEKGDSKAAADWLDRLEDHVLKTAGTLPNLGREVPELGRRDIRETSLDRRYRIAYRISGDEVVIVTVFDGRRRWESIGVDPDAN